MSDEKNIDANDLKMLPLNYNPLTLAVKNGDVELVKVLLDQQHIDLGTQGIGIKAFILAFKANNKAIISLLKEKREKSSRFLS